MEASRSGRLLSKEACSLTGVTVSTLTYPGNLVQRLLAVDHLIRLFPVFLTIHVCWW